MKILIILVIVLIVVIGVVYFLQQPKYGQNTMPSQSPVPTASGINVSPKTYNIAIENFAFNPVEINVKNGDTVIWMNQDSMAHRISGNSFNSDTLNKGQSFSFTFNTIGTFDYICSIHPSMKGKIVVQ